MRTLTKNLIVVPLLVLGQTLPTFSQQTNESSGGLFIENSGQVVDQFKNPRKDVLYSGAMTNMVFHLKNTGISYQFTQVNAEGALLDQIPANGAAQQDQFSVYRLDVNWLGANENSQVTPFKPSTFGEPINGESAAVVAYDEVVYSDIYENIDLRYYQQHGQLKYDFEVAPFADYHHIQFELEGAQEIQIQENGSVLIRTPFGNVLEEAPVVYQNGQLIASKWNVDGNRLSFELFGYDPSLRCIIDPIVREWGTYYGGNDVDTPSSVKVDSENNVYLFGQTFSTSTLSIATVGAHQVTLSGESDAFLVKFDPLGNRVWGTYFGVDGAQYGNGMAIDADDNVYLIGSTAGNANSGLTTPNCHQSVYGGGEYDVFLAKFTSDGVLLWSTLFGGTGWDSGYSCEVDATGNVYITGQTGSPNAIATAGTHQTTFDGGISDAYVAKFDPIGNLLWGTYFGGSEYDASYACSLDENDQVYVTGFTESDGGEISTASSHQPTRGGLADGFLAKFDGTTGNRIWGTFYGGSGYEQGGLNYNGYSCVCDGNGSVYMCGTTSSAQNIATANSHQPVIGGYSDAFLVKFTTDGVREWGTYYGGTGVSGGYTCALDAFQNVYLSGETASDEASAIATIDAFKSSTEGSSDNFVVAFNSAGQRLWGTFYGGESYESKGYSAIDDLGNIYLAGITDALSSSDKIVTPDGHQTVCNAFQESYLVKLSYKDVTEISEVSLNDFTIYPNPVESALHIKTNGAFENGTVAIYNLAGELMLQTPLTSQQSLVDVSGFASGMYLLQIKSGNRRMETHKFTKN